ncbi:DNA polymerase alpha catalytic subunit-like isoform X2 [Coccinella septempunctata]|uniref:DNA polymerase alpha catalytic subunit-like isoform X2 n=1 Tax=Coccinella septempunctata TaxID=41139 RepID=UPI001D08FAB8|nr:DNA polymerase alpha catalytic subunit-like isoform X2 [Coccinella septempunctata]
MPKETPDLNDSCIDVDELKKEFNVSDFAKSLWPNLKVENDDIEETFYGDFLDDLEKKLENDETSPQTKNNLEALRTWSHVRFKKAVPVKTEEASVFHQEEKDIEEMEVSNEESQGRTISDLRSDMILKFMEDENKWKGTISNKLNNDVLDLPLVEYEKKKFFRFFYLDAYEKLYGEEATVYLFGKTYCYRSKSYKSCSVAVCPLIRRLFISPRHYAADENAENIQVWATRLLKEFYERALKPLNIKRFKYRFVKKKNLEEILSSSEQIMLEVEYSAHYPTVDQKLEGKTFSAVFGTKNSCFENFLLEKKIKGPCWLDVSNPRKPNRLRTSCFFEVSCCPEQISHCESIAKSSSPPLTLLSFHMRSVSQNNNIALFTLAVNYNYDIWNENSTVVDEQSHCSFIFVTSDEDLAELPEVLKTLRRTKIEKINSEKDMLTFFLEEFHKIDPDIVVVYDIQNKEFHRFIDRLESLKIEDCNKLSRFKGASSNSNLRQFVFSGRMVCDLRYLAKEFALSRNYELDELFEKFLGIKKEQRWVVDLKELVSSTGRFSNIAEWREEFLEIFISSINESFFLLKLVAKTNIIPLAVKLTEICGNVLSQTFTGGITRRSEYLLSHAFYEQNFIVPYRLFKKSTENEDDEILTGGLVLEPKEGFYDNYILLMDFQSLYPSIIYGYNLCISHNEFDNASTMPPGVLPQLMSHFIERRKTVKSRMKSLDKHSNTYFRYQIYQTALKLSANSVYGCIAFQNFRYKCPSLAQDITRKAREILSSTVQLLKTEGFEIIYGDTDSVMVNTNSTDLQLVNCMAQKITQIVNSHYSSLNLRVDTIFKRLLIIAKKKYAGIAVDFRNGEAEDTVLKGLDIIRYDWPPYVCKIGKNIIDIILSDHSQPEKCKRIKEMLKQIERKLLHNEVPKESLVITKYLTQDPTCYSQETRLPHVQVALRCNEKNLFNFKSGDAVTFLMCSDKKRTFNQKAYHLKELSNMEDVEIDGSYYFNKQVYSFVSKICLHIGLDLEVEQFLCSKNDFKKIEVVERTEEIEFESRKPFDFDCLKCGHSSVLDNENFEILDKCQNSECDFSPINNLIYLKNRLILAIRSYIQKYYKYELKCSNTKCSYATLRIPLSYRKGNNTCPACAEGKMLQVFNEADLFLQLKYFKYIFECGLLTTIDGRKQDALKSLMLVVDGYEEQSGFRSVNLTEIFGTL